MTDSIEPDIALLHSLLSNTDTSDDAENLQQLLAQLNDAEGIAKGLEGKLDDVLENLDSLLAAMEAKEAERTRQHGTTEQKSQPDTCT